MNRSAAGHRVRHGLAGSLLLWALMALSPARAADDAALDASLTRVAHRALVSAPAITGQDKARVRLQAHYDAHAHRITVDYAAGYVPANDVQMETQQEWIGNSVAAALAPDRPVRGIEFLYAGKPLSHYFPVALPPAAR